MGQAPRRPAAPLSFGGADHQRTIEEDEIRHRELREEITRVSRKMSASGLVPTTSGNASARTPEGDVLITPSGLPYEDLEPEDVVLVTLEGEVLEGAPSNPRARSPCTRASTARSRT